MSARRLKSIALIGGILTSGLTLLAWTQSWFTLDVSTTDAARARISVAGSVAAPDLSALSLAGLALVAALAISGPALRIVFGAIEIAIGAGVAVSSIAAMASPVAASTAAVTKATGVSGTASVARLVASTEPSVWPVIAVVLGCLTALVGLFTIITWRRWPGSARRYEASPDARSMRSSGPVSDWDSLSGGEDPTSR
ncbi:Trp biosynthesis-associated membrane protein [Parafrigoribacterium soli]|uniref:Trp biosynthesis-associated membrane protein n=1 Tax=Parafrigoribacterium soli TaxID=3144663 RepID=UPI0032ED54E1